MVFSRLNALDQALDIAGSLTQTQTMVLSEEPLGYGAAIAGQTGSAANVTTTASPLVTITGLTGMTAQSVGRMLTISGAASSGNNGTFLINTFNSSASVDVVNAVAVASDANNGAITWTERQPYSLEDDLNYNRTDHRLMKGTTNWYDAVPTYTRPTATGTPVPTNLTNIAGKTTDAVAYTVNRAYYGYNVVGTPSNVTVTSVGNFRHADSTNRIGIPCFDTGPFAGSQTSCYVHIVDGYSTGSELTVLSGPQAGQRIFGLTYAGASTSPDEIVIAFFSAPFATDYSAGYTAYNWEVGQPTTVNFLYGYNERLDQLDVNAFRTVPALGILTDASLGTEINNILQTIGTTSVDTSLNGLLTNTIANYVFFNLPDATPSVVEALNTLNAQIGDRTYTGAILTSGQTIAASLQALSNSISTTTITRTIERLAADINANTAHTLPGGLTYTLDGTNNGQFLWVYTRGVLRDPGPVSGGNDYTETSTTSVTFYAKNKSGDHINYFKKG